VQYANIYVYMRFWGSHRSIREDESLLRCYSVSRWWIVTCNSKTTSPFEKSVNICQWTWPIFYEDLNRNYKIFPEKKLSLPGDDNNVLLLAQYKILLHLSSFSYFRLLHSRPDRFWSPYCPVSYGIEVNLPVTVSISRCSN
jgi:hypothetical protein